jgi:predicted AAA+ superfamily ATPase
MLDLSPFISIQINLLKNVPKRNRRFIYTKINWNSRLIGLIGARGTGKTTLLLQNIAEQDGDPDNCIYISADHIKVQAISLYDIAAQFYKLGGKCLFIDEIHKYNRWQQELKSIYDSFPNAKIRFSGSSSLKLHLGKADLSRRAVFYVLPGLSFREYLEFIDALKFAAVSLEDILYSHGQYESQIVPELPILRHFQRYLEHGVYPFFLEGIEEYTNKLGNVIEKVLYEDIVSTSNMNPTNVSILKKIIWLVATSQPFKPNMESISKNLGISKPSLYGYFDYLIRAGLLSGVMPEGSGAKLTRKPEKLYINDTNLLKAISGELRKEDPIGTIRETFVQHQLISAGLPVSIPTIGDFLVKHQYLLEVGGRRKKIKQIADKKNAFIVKDDIDTGFGNIIPMWLVGFLY